jgi:hypothetical protein
MKNQLNRIYPSVEFIDEYFQRVNVIYRKVGLRISFYLLSGIILNIKFIDACQFFLHKESDRNRIIIIRMYDEGIPRGEYFSILKWKRCVLNCKYDLMYSIWLYGCSLKL